MQVLVVEDNADVAWALSRLLDNLGHDVVSCATPKLALEAVRSFNPDLVLLDIELPEVDGYTLAVLLRERGLTTPIMVLSACEDDPARRCAASIDGHYMKPVSSQQVQEILASVSES